MNSTEDKSLVAAIVLTMNEERDLPKCLRSLEGIASEIYVVDSGSTDRTRQIAEQFGATVFYHPFENQARQFNWALDTIAIEAGWILRIDADERLHPELVVELRSLLPDVTGIEVPRRICFLGRNIRFGDMYPVWLLRIFRKGTGRSEDRWMDEYIELSRGRTVRVRGDLMHDIPKDLTDWTAKHNLYASRECTDILASQASASADDGKGARRQLKQSVYLRLPPFFRALAYWFYRYVLKLGFLDGEVGLIYHFLHSFWYRFLIDAKLYEAEAAARSNSQKST